jgi:hypothetical protein
MARVVCATAFSYRAEGLAGVACQDDVEGTSEVPGIETTQIIPNWCRGELTRALGRDEDASGISFPLDEGAGVEAWFGQHDAQIQASAACAEGQSVPGT